MHIKRIVPYVLTCALVALCGCGMKNNYEVNYENIKTSTLDINAASVHDPSIIKVDDVYYIFGSHLSCAKSGNLSDWEMLTSKTNAYSRNNPVYTDMKDLDSGEFHFTGNGASVIPTDDKTVHIWAPDVIYNKALGKYFMYYCTSSTFNSSTIVYGTSDNPNGPYEWKGNLLYSGETVNNIEETDILNYVDLEYAKQNYMARAGYEYNYKDYPNCIDPCVFYDADGRMWMVYGSWSGGIFIIEIDESTGEVIHPKGNEAENVDPYYGKKLLGGGHHSIEGPYIQYDESAGYYYLFVSYGELTRDGGYQIRVFRSQSPDGPYVDMNNQAPDNNSAHENFGLKLSGNYYLPSLEAGYKATGHNSSIIDDDGRKYVVYHTRFDKPSERHTPIVKQYILNEDGWPCLLPYKTSGETVSEKGYTQKSLAGRYFVINQGTDISSAVCEPFILYLNENGTVTGNEISGSWEAEPEKYFMHITVNDKEYHGVFCEMNDEAQTPVITFSAVGENESIWGVKYIEEIK